MGQAKIEDMEYQEEKTLTTKFLPLGCPKSYMGGKKQTSKQTSTPPKKMSFLCRHLY